MNNATRKNVATLGVVFGISGMSHGFFEVLQGNTPTGSLYISAIGEAQRLWPHGNEPAFTLIPNFLITGVAAMLVGLGIIIWSLGFVHKKNGPTILLLLFILLLLVGGGVAQILFFPWIWLVSTRINKPLTWWRKYFPANHIPSGRLWALCLTTSTLLLLSSLVIAATGFIPGVEDSEAVLTVMLLCLASEVILLPLTFIFGFGHDIGTKTISA